MKTTARHWDNFKTVVKRLFCDHNYNWWCNKRDPELIGDADKRLRFNVSEWYCNKCHKTVTRQYPYYG